MKKYIYLLPLLIMALLSSCDSDTKEQPTVLPDIARIEVVAIEGHLHGQYGFHETADPEGQKYMRRFHKFVYRKQADGTMALAPESDRRLIVTGGKDESGEMAAAIGFWIDYFDAQERNITMEVLGGENAAKVQHFFTAHDLLPTFDGDEAEIKGLTEDQQVMNYIYCDTDPLTARIKDGAKVVGDQNPIGHKGYFGFLVPKSRFTLQITLADLSNIGKNAKGTPFAFYDRPAKSRPLVQVEVPVTIYAHTYDYLESENIEEMTADELAYLDAIAHAYGISRQEALDAYLKRLDAPGHNSSGYWF
ncbi:MAG: hypothetical protein Q4E10_02805 [Porphyromonas sp.]|nr:hypothetical protein [Porphyromonas sp.]